MLDQEQSRRDFLMTGGAVAAGLAIASSLEAHPGHSHTPGSQPTDSLALMHLLFHGATNEAGEFVLPELPYALDALEPHIDAKTMELHYSKHHAAYVNNANATLKAMAAMRESGDFAFVDHWSERLAFNAGGHYLHTMFWNCMGPNAGGEPQGALAEAITRDFGSFAGFKAHFSAASKGVQGSGWGLMGLSIASGRLEILQAQNQHLNTSWGFLPLLGVDVWEHAYYLKYQNNRGQYVDNWWNTINWVEVGLRYDLIVAALKK
jgi:Fe-Mn family superoxide dismutase